MPLNTDIYNLKIEDMMMFFAILPLQTRSPKGIENNKVKQNIPQVNLKPSSNWSKVEIN